MAELQQIEQEAIGEWRFLRRILQSQAVSGLMSLFPTRAITRIASVLPDGVFLILHPARGALLGLRKPGLKRLAAVLAFLGHLEALARVRAWARGRAGV